MTLRYIYESLLTEIGKVSSPSMLLADFNYWINKAIKQVVNKRYALFEVDQQTSDDLRALFRQVTLTPDSNNIVKLPGDYFHLLNCICVFEGNRGCYNGEFYSSAKKLNSDTLPIVMNDYYQRPTYKRPYYFLHNLSIKSNSQDQYNQFSEIINIDQLEQFDEDSSISPQTEISLDCEIKWGEDKNVSLKAVKIDYLKTPKIVELTQVQINTIDDTSEIMEFQDYMCQEIINELVHLVLDTNADPRLQTNLVVTDSIASPVQQQK